MISLKRFDPFENLDRDFRNMLERHFGGWKAADESTAALSTWSPRMDVYENVEAITVKMDLPGIDQKDLQINLENNVMTVSGERKFEHEDKHGNCQRAECFYGTFSRSFTIPNTVAADQIKANYKDGVLSLTLPKKEESKPKRIDIKLS